jgi:hypothetical protein
MRPLFEDFDEFDFDDSPSVARLLREHRLEESRFATRTSTTTSTSTTSTKTTGITTSTTKGNSIPMPASA